MKEYFYYFRDERRQPVVTVCLMKNDNGVLARGISIASVQDVVCKKDGRDRARGRAVKALVNATSSEEIRTDRALKQMKFADIGLYMYKSEFDPSLNSFEKKLMRVEDAI